MTEKVGKPFEPSYHRPAEDQEKYRGKSREEHHGDDRGEHRAANREAGGGNFLSVLITGSCWQLIDSHLHRKLAAKVGENVGCKSGCQRLEGWQRQ